VNDTASFYKQALAKDYILVDTVEDDSSFEFA
jgi:hypothetical protein